MTKNRPIPLSPRILEIFRKLQLGDELVRSELRSPLNPAIHGSDNTAFRLASEMERPAVPLPDIHYLVDNGLLESEAGYTRATTPQLLITGYGRRVYKHRNRARG